MNLRDEIILSPVRKIRDIVSIAYAMDSEDITKVGRKERKKEARDVATYISRRALNYASLRDLASALGFTNHSSVAHAVRRTYDRVENDKAFGDFVSIVEEQAKSVV